MPKKVLIVEDEPTVLTALKKKLLFEKFDIITASNGREGLIQAKLHQPDLILLDIIMPVMDGITMLKRLRKNPECKNIPVIILTNLSDTLSIKNDEDFKITNYLIKSDWKLKDLVIKIQQVFAV